ncbi:VOC family protein [Zhihengliuella salsuginis]|uniref:Glyoxalase n=1 Tax=Zhihengliuella salsuginis TaxID=578222 RepID=A0ABQ3GBY2_9MICC|nr:VOC family protein [Zhihengliuella salsuginis]GHC98849.1 glyoxalase [Zhihengliuella salsuginis]
MTSPLNTLDDTRDRLDARSDVGAVTLKVADLDGMIHYYTDAVGLGVIAQQGSSAVLGRGGRPAVILEHAPALRHAPEGAAGLFHTAIVFETRADLAAAVHKVATAYPGRFVGSSDHLVSEAFYFDDPEGNGVELYFDRPRETWAWDGDRVRMDTVFLDPNAYLRENLTASALAAPAGEHDAGVGHVHLKVGDVATARAFYTGVVGFDLTATIGTTAAFFSVGGYHHHIAANTWSSRGATGREPSLGLGEIDLVLPDRDAVGALRERLASHGVAQHDDGRTVTFEDPWRNALRVTAG